MKAVLNVYLFLVMAVLISESVHAVEKNKDVKDEITTQASENRESSIKLTLYSGRDNFRETEISGSFGLDSVWALNGSVGVERSDGIRSASSFSFGATSKLSDQLDFNSKLISRREPDSVVARGLVLGIGWDFSRLWDAVLATELGLQATFMRYKQDDGTRTRVRDGGISQRSISITLAQEVSESTQLSVQYTAYGLGGADANELSQAVSNRPNITPEFMSVVQGFPKRQFGVGSDFILNDDWGVQFHVFRTEYYSAPASRGLSLSADYSFDKSWTIGAGVSGTKTGSNDSNQGLLELSLSYRF